VYGSVSGWCLHCQCRYHHHTLMCHKYHDKHTSKQCKVTDRTVWRRTMDVRTAVSGTAPRRQAFYHRSQLSLYKQGPHNICHAHPGKYYISGVKQWQHDSGSGRQYSEYSQMSLMASTSRLSSSQMRTTRVCLLRVFFLF